MYIQKLMYTVCKAVNKQNVRTFRCQATKLIVDVFVLVILFAFSSNLVGTNSRALGDDETNYLVSSESEIKNAVGAINVREDGNYTITLGADITIENNPNYLKFEKNSVTIHGENHTLSLVKSYINVTGNSTLNLGSASYNKTLSIKDKAPQTGNACDPLISVNNATLNMYKGVTLSGRNGVDTAGGVQLEKSKFNMHGGEISDCRSDSIAGGVLANNHSEFKMTGGTIKNCKSSNSGGGIYVRDNSTCTIDGGKVENCEASRSGGGVYVYNSQFKMNDGTIQDCSSVNYGGGIYTNSKFEMSGGTISGCTNSGYGGGGVCIYTPRGTDTVGFEMSGGKIVDCVANSNINYGLGGGVLVINGLADVKGESEIYNNHASMAGDDIFSFGTNGKLKLTDVPEGLVLSETNHEIDGWYVDGVVDGEDTARWDKDNFAQKYVPSPEQTIVTQIALKAAHGPIDYNYYNYTLKYYLDGELDETLTQTGKADTVHLDDVSALDNYKIDSVEYINVVEPTAEAPGSFEVNVYCSKSLEPTRELRCKTELNGQVLEVILQDPNSALPDDVYLKVTLIPKGTARWNELYGELDGTNSIKNLAFFEIELLYKSNDMPVTPMPLSKDVKILFQIPNGWNKEDLKVLLIMVGADNIEFEEEIEHIDVVDYLAFWISHLSPYALIEEKLTEEEKEIPIVEPKIDEPQKSDVKSGSSSSDKRFPKTGESDLELYVISGVCLVSLVALFIMMIGRKRKTS